MGHNKGPEWKHVTILKEEEGKNPQVKCVYCDFTFFGGATRIRGHFLSRGSVGVKACSACPEASKKELEGLETSKRVEQNKKRRLQELDRAASAPPAIASKQSTIHAAFQKQDKTEVDSLWARAFFGNGLPFRLIEDS